MKNCYLCSAEAEVFGQDYGRRKNVHCPNCGYYEVTNTAIAKLENDGMPEAIRANLIKTIRAINENDKCAEIVVDEKSLSAYEKQ